MHSAHQENKVNYTHIQISGRYCITFKKRLISRAEALPIELLDKELADVMVAVNPKAKMREIQSQEEHWPWSTGRL